MRHLVMMTALLALLAVSNAVWADQTFRLGVDGLACPFCAYGIEKKFEKAEGVSAVDIRINEGVVQVTVVEGANFDKARAQQIVKEAGFTLRNFEKLTEAQ